MTAVEPQVPKQFTDDELVKARKSSADARKVRVKLKAKVADSKIKVFEVLDVGQRGGGDQVVGHMHIGELLRAVDGIGKVKSADILEAAGVDDDEKHLDTLTIKQRVSIGTSLRAHFASQS